MNDKVYIHEFIDITKQNRAKYMHHIAANWSPIGQEERHQLCYGVWGVVGSTGRWPQVVNMWEEDGFAGLADSFRIELSNSNLQDPSLAKWWAGAADLRSGGIDRIMVPHHDTSPIEELCAAGATGEVYAHEFVQVRPGTARSFLSAALNEARRVPHKHGWQLVGAWWTAMHNEDECLLLWTIPSWESWAQVENEYCTGIDALLPDTSSDILRRDRILLVDAPLSPFRTGRQPSRADRTDWTD
ncbi:hypothetical protein R4P64_31335 [Rhodococcus sp. IEGM 1366]|uniref:hypothetical protein n=1 Tax=Rhodococcus sp. IEGM 1366 TaxID=3082223 RepID=UPI002955D38E|nr:hypothetical protein [Rhodococcus sp. IEGM 1366]MDV8071013.1 hypothetical protein [Rhodococcus sp. IEGM 1366]